MASSSSIVKRSVHWDANPTSTPAKTATGAQNSSSSLTPVKGSSLRGSPLSHFQPWTSPHSMPGGALSNPSPSAAPTPSAAAVRAPTYGNSVLKSRMKWNGTALLVLSVIERLPLTRKLWWSILDTTYRLTGSDLDVTLNTLAQYLSWVLFIVFFGNILEAFLRYTLFSQNTSALPARASDSSIASSPAFTNGIVRSSPKTRPTASTAMPFSPSPRHASSSGSADTPTRAGSTSASPGARRADSPLRQSILAASRSAAAPRSQNQSFGGGAGDRSFDQSFPSSFSSTLSGNDYLQQAGGQRRLPSTGLPAVASNSPSQSSFTSRVFNPSKRASASALEAFKARHASTSSNADDYSLADISTESFEVERALRRLSANMRDQQPQQLATPAA